MIELSNSPEILPKLAKGALVEEFEGEYVIHVPFLEKTYLVDSLMVLVLSYCDGQRTVDEITNLVVRMYPEKKQDILKDVPDMIEDMLTNRVLEG